ncbi:CatB-related O-acetyltransferase [Maricaulis sp. D1M11]|uniref:CatB-related O-acetyltransferase n=1 Tax=Maricaulis sp. D1M11 TaxID=3076117 RepID=UPI0039B3EC40
MAVIQLDAKRKDKLSELGLRFPAASSGLALHPKTLIEAPVFCVAGLHSSTEIKIGGYALINGGSLAHFSMGRYCSLANNIAVGFAEHPIDRLTSSTASFSHDFQGWRTYSESIGRTTEMQIAPFNDRPITKIGNDVWIGQGAFLKSGVTIGDGAIIAAHAAVVKDVPPYAIVGGVPAKIIRYRFPREIIDRLLALKWWDYCLFEFGGVNIEKIEQSVSWLEKNINNFEKLEPKYYSVDDLIALVE